MQALSNLIDYENVANVSLSKNPFRWLPDELALEIFSYFPSYELPVAFSVCHEFKRLASDHALIRNEIQAFDKIIEQLLLKNSSRAKIVESIKKIEENKEGNPWLNMMELANKLKGLLDGMSLDELASFSPPRLLLNDAPLVDKYIMRSFVTAWQKKIEARVAQQGYFDLKKETKFSDGSFALFLTALEKSPNVKKIVLYANLEQRHMQTFFQKLSENKLPIQELRVIRDVDSPPAQIILNALLNSLANNTTLTSLQLQYCGVNDPNVHALAQALQTKKNLEELRINDFAFSNAGLQTLTQMLHDNPSLKTLCLERASHGELEPLMEALNQFHLDTLELSECQISNLAADLLAEAIRTNTKLKTLVISRSQIEQENIEKLIEALKVNRTIKNIQILSRPLFELQGRTVIE